MGYAGRVASSSKTIPPRAGTSDLARFPAEQCAALLEAIAVHDTVDLAAELPDEITLDYEASLLDRCYWISFQLWHEVGPRLLARLATQFAQGRTLSSSDAKAFKDVRARAKQLRFAYATLGEGHAYPVRLDRITRLMGKVQDAMKTGHRVGATVRGVLLRAMVTRRGSAALLREGEQFRATTPETFRAHILAEIESIRATLAEPAVTNKAFHETRKIVSRLVAFYDTLTILAPSEVHRAVDRYLSTINGLMGAMHDEMVGRKAESRRAYLKSPEPLPPEIADRLARLVAAFSTGAATRA